MSKQEAINVQMERERIELAHHRERLEWLTGDDVRWADGTPVAKHDIFSLLDQSRRVIAELTANGRHA